VQSDRRLILLYGVVLFEKIMSVGQDVSHPEPKGVHKNPPDHKFLQINVITLSGGLISTGSTVLYHFLSCS
jgi:hypothetical protein